MVCQIAFEKLKSGLVNPYVLGFPEFDYPFILETDGSLKRYGAILSQK